MNKGYFIGWLMLGYENGSTWSVINDRVDTLFGYELSNGHRIIVPDNFKTDFATIPRMLWIVAPPVGFGARAAYGKAAVVHDYLYRQIRAGDKTFTRKEADNIFLECMEISNVSWFRRYVMWSAVRLFGWLFRFRKQ